MRYRLISRPCVDRSREHFELRYGSAKDHGWNEWMPVALVSREEADVFGVEYLIDAEDPKNAAMVGQMMHELRFYLLDKGEPDPWNYAHYHCTTAANLYSPVHWSFKRSGTPGVARWTGSRGH